MAEERDEVTAALRLDITLEEGIEGDGTSR